MRMIAAIAPQVPPQAAASPAEVLIFGSNEKGGPSAAPSGTPMPKRTAHPASE